MTKLERLKWLKEIEKDIHVCSLESTFADDAKSCAIHSVIEELEKGTGGVISELKKIKSEIELMDFDFGDYYDNTDTIIEMVSKVIDKRIEELKGSD